MSSSRTSSLKGEARPPIPNRSSSTSRTGRTGKPTSSVQAPPTTSSEKPPIPQRAARPATVRHSLLPDDGRPIDFLKHELVPESDKSAQNQHMKDSCPGTTTRRSASCSAATRKSMCQPKIQRWAGLTRSVGDWDGLRRDPELWYEDGDCFVYLHSNGASRRGPSFCIPYRILRQKKCSAILNHCEAQMTPTTGSNPQQLRRMPSSLGNSKRGSSTVQLFFPAPEALSREESFRWHISTRNFFAFLLGKPLVGEHMGQTYVELQERLRLFRPEANNDLDFLDYAENQGYRDLVECTDYALAILFYAEHYKHREIWIDAFAHCVGMNDSLALSPEYSSTSRLTKALITRAHVEVDIHLGRVSNALSNFLDEDLSSTYLGLTQGARSHLDRFRRFLNLQFQQKFGHWPPPAGASFPKALYKSMYYDFKNLYDYLVDTESTTDIALQKPASGGICVLQNVGNFDKRHNFKAQPHPLPLLPTYSPPTRKAESQKALRQMTLASQHNKTHQFYTMSAALAVATNTLKKDVTGSKIIQAYMHFEREYAMDTSQREEKVSVIDARKVRWLLIYGTLQYLTSALLAPKEVRDAETADYPLCCLVAGQNTWNGDIKVATPPAHIAMNTPQALDEHSPGLQFNPCAIQPDCHREDYFSSRSVSRRGSIETPTPVKMPQPSRSSSTRSFGPLSLSARSSRRNSLTLKPTQHCAIIIQGYGDGLNETTPCHDSARPVSSVYSEQSTRSILPDGAGPDTSWLRPRTPSAPHSRNPSSTAGSTISRSRTPLLDSNQLSEFTYIKGESETPTRSDSTGSTCSSVWSEGGSAASSKSSADGEHPVSPKASPAEDSGLLGGLVSVSQSPMEIPRTRSLTKPYISQSHIHPLLRRPSKRDSLRFNFSNRSSEGSLTPSMPHTTNTTIGMALSAPSSPPMHPVPDSHITDPTHDLSLKEETRPCLAPRSVTIDSTPTVTSAPSKGRGTDVFSALITPSHEVWEQYKAALTRPHESRPTTATTDTTITSSTKSSYSFRMPSFKLSTKIGNDDEQNKKKDKRLSLLWRR